MTKFTQKQQENSRQTRSLISMGHRNVLKCSKGKAESYDHRYLKYLLADYCWAEGIDFQTEVVFKDNSRADFVVEPWGIVFEVLHSEKPNDFKKKNYPLPTIPLHTAEWSNGELTKMLDELKNTNGGVVDYYLKKGMETFEKNT